MPPSWTASGLIENQQKQPIAGWTSIRSAELVAVFSFTALRNLFFPPDKPDRYKPDGARNEAARAVLAAMALLGVALQREQGDHLRSGCDLRLKEPAKTPALGVLPTRRRARPRVVHGRRS